MIKEIIFVSGLFIAIMFTIINLTKTYYKQSIPMGNIIAQTIGVVVIVLKWAGYY